MSKVPCIFEFQKFLVVLSVVVACVVADVSHLESAAGIVRSENTINPDGSYGWGIETQNGIAAQEQGNIKLVNVSLSCY